MDGKDRKLMSVREVRMYEEIKRVLNDKITQAEAARNLKKSERQTRRLVKKVQPVSKPDLSHEDLPPGEGISWPGVFAFFIPI